MNFMLYDLSIIIGVILAYLIIMYWILVFYRMIGLNGTSERQFNEALDRHIEGNPDDQFNDKVYLDDFDNEDRYPQPSKKCIICDKEMETNLNYSPVIYSRFQKVVCFECIAIIYQLIE